MQWKRVQVVVAVMVKYLEMCVTVKWLFLGETTKKKNISTAAQPFHSVFSCKAHMYRYTFLCLFCTTFSGEISEKRKWNWVSEWISEWVREERDNTYAKDEQDEGKGRERERKEKNFLQKTYVSQLVKNEWWLLVLLICPCPKENLACCFPSLACLCSTSHELKHTHTYT